ncbi:MAG: endopeptidase La [Bdellovibrionales bacterium]
MSKNSTTQTEQVTLPLLPLRDLIIFPHMMMPLFVGRDRSIKALEEAMTNQTDIILVAQKDAKTNSPEPKDIYSIGTVGSIIQLLRLPDGTVKVLVEGKGRVRIDEYVNQDQFYTAKATVLEEIEAAPLETQALVRSVKTTFENYVKLNKRIPPEILMRVSSIEEASELADIVVAQLNLKIEDKQKLLEVIDPGSRLEELLNIMTGEIEILEVEKRIRSRVKKQMEQSQKEYYLNEQMQAIQKELGDKDDFQAELDELVKEAASKKMSEDARKKLEKELKKLRMMSPMSAEAAVARNYIDWLVALPWGTYNNETLDLVKAKAILDEDHWGLEKVKDRIVEHLAVQTLAKDNMGPIICLVGPPGVGKTSLGRSIARALNREFDRISLGGVRDEAEIRGHRRTYVGALPGRIIQTLRKGKTNNPLILLDEIDKMSNDFRGDPSAALLEVLDPSQNKTFADHFLEVDYDLSKVLFFTTANSLHTIPGPLLDRMEVIQLEGYISREKLEIAKSYLVPKQIKAHGLGDYGVEFTDSALMSIIEEYTREAGVRTLERTIGTVCRKLARQIVEAELKAGPKTKSKKSHKVGPKKVVELLGSPKVKHGKIEKAHEIGLTNGMAWTQVGGDLLVVEVSVVPGRGKFTITGQLGDVMKESCAAALSYVRSRGPLFGFDKEYYANHDIHIHVPEGAIPKDGPSAGIAITTSIVSAMMKIPVTRTVAMTGEVTLRGRVLAIGGLKAKVIAAHRGGIRKIIIPKANETDLEDIPKDVLADITVILVDHVDQVLVNALEVKDAKEIFKNRAERGTGIKPQHTGHSEQVAH